MKNSFVLNLLTKAACILLPIIISIRGIIARVTGNSLEDAIYTCTVVIVCLLLEVIIQKDDQ